MLSEIEKSSSGRAAERRYLSMMFVDLVGYTGLSEQLDPEDLAALQHRYQNLALTVMERFGGFVANFAGDGILVYFGYPIAHENDAERALRAGLELLERLGRLDRSLTAGAIAPLEARIGVHTGLVVLEPELVSSGATVHGAVGEAVNLAARLQAEAPPGGIVVSTETRRLVEALFDFRSLGERPIKGLSRQVEIHQVTRVLARPAGPSRPRSTRSAARMVGRDDAMARILSRWNTAQEQSRCQTVLVVGEAGLGKTRLVKELCGRPELAGATILQTHCYEIFSNTPLYPVGSFLWARAGLTNEDDEAKRHEKLVGLLHELGLATPDNERLIASFPSLTTSTTIEPLAPTPQLFKRRQYDFVSSILARTSHGRPTLLWIEDVHWLDPSSAELLHEIVAALANTPTLVLLTSRSFPRGPTLPEPTELIRLQQLEVDECLEIARTLSAAESFSDDILMRAVQAAEGVPLFVEQLVLSLIDGEKRQGRRHTDGLPLMLAEMMSERLDRRPGARRIVQAAACIGRSFRVDFLGALLHEDSKELANRLEALVDAEILLPKRYGAEIRYEFRHSLLQRMAYDSMVQVERRAMHARMVAVLREREDAGIPEVIAHHLTEAGVFPEAARSWLLAGVNAAKRSAHLEAIDHLRRGLGLLDKIPDPDLRRELELNLQAGLIGSITTTQGATSLELAACCERGLQLCREGSASPLVFPFIFGQFTFANCRGRTAESASLAEMFLHLAERAGYDSGRVIGYRLRGMARLGEGRIPAAKEDLERSLALYSPERDAASTHMFGQNTEVHSQALLSLTLFCAGDVNRALEVGRDALAAADALHHPHSTAIALCYVGGWVFGLCNATEYLFREARRLVALSEQHRLRGFSAHGVAFVGWALCQRGELDEGMANISRAIEGFDHAEYRLAISGYLVNLADAQRRANRLKEAKRSSARALEITLESSFGWHEPEALRVDALVERELSPVRPERIEEKLRHAVTRAREIGVPVLERRCLLSLQRFLGPAREDFEVRSRLSTLAHLDDLASRVEAVVASCAPG